MNRTPKKTFNSWLRRATLVAVMLTPLAGFAGLPSATSPAFAAETKVDMRDY